MPTDEEIIKARQDFEPEYPSGDEKRFQGSQEEQAQNQRTVTQQKKHNEFYKQELRQTGKHPPPIPPSDEPETDSCFVINQAYKPNAPDPPPAVPEESA